MSRPSTEGDIQQLVNKLSDRVKRISEVIDKERQTAERAVNMASKLAIAGGALAVAGSITSIVTFSLGAHIVAGAAALLAGGAILFSAANAIDAIKMKHYTDEIESMRKSFVKYCLGNCKIDLKSKEKAKTALIYVMDALDKKKRDISEVK